MKMSLKIREYFWLGSAVLSIAALAVFIPYLYGGEVNPVQAATRTVCAAGCDFTTISAALSDPGTAAGDVIRVLPGYVSSTEPTDGPIAVEDENITIECQDQSTVVGTSTLIDLFGPERGFDLQFATGTTFRNCTLENVNFNLTPSGTPAPNVTISENIFTSGTGYFSYVGLSENTLFASNTGQVAIDGGSSSGSIIQGNVIDVPPPGGGAWGSTSNLIIRNNTFYQTSSNTSVIGQVSEPNNFTLTNNRFLYRDTLVIGDNGVAPFFIDTAYGTLTIEHNLFEYGPRNTTSSYRGISFGRATGTVEMSIQHNTFVFYDNVDRVDITQTGPGTTTLNLSYNLFTVKEGANGQDARAFRYDDGALDLLNYITGTVQYNGFYNLDSDTEADRLINFDSSSTIPVENSLVLVNPYFKNADADTTNDYELAPFSPYLDVNGALDVGYYSATRGSSFTIDDNGVIDYAAVHATTTAVIELTARDGDTWSLAAGNYGPISLVSSTNLSGSSLVINGSGSATIISATENFVVPLYLENINSATVGNMVLQNGTTTASSYFINNTSFSLGGTDYDDSQLFGGPENIMFFVTGVGCGDNFLPYVSLQNSEVTSLVDGVSDWHLALINVAAFAGGTPTYLTMWIPDQVYSTAAELNAPCGGAIIVDTFVTSALAVADGEYTYDSAAIAAAGITLDPDTQTPPTMTRQLLGGGIQLSNSSNNTFVNVTSTGNIYGISLSGSSAGNTFTSSTLTGSLSYDLISTVETGANIFENVLFTLASSTFSGDGVVQVKYRARAQIQDVTTTPIVGVSVGFESANTIDSDTVVSGVGGFTPYSDYILAHIMSSSTSALTAGGYNPYTVTASATSTYSATSTNVTLSSPDQTVVLTMFDAPAPPDAPSGLQVDSVSTSSIVISWVDNSNDETGFIVDYNTTSTFPGTTTTLAVNTTSTTISGLAENTQYSFRVAAYNGSGASAYTTGVTASYTLMSAPTVSVSEVTTSSVRFSISTPVPASAYQLINVLDPATTTFFVSNPQLTDLDLNTAYQYKVRVLNEDDVPSPLSATTTAVTLTVAPSDLTAIAAGQTSIELGWTLNSSTAYLVQNVTTGATTSVAGPTTLGGLNCGTSYTFRVAGLNALEVASEYGSSVSATTSACPSGGGSSSGGGNRTVTRETYNPDTQEEQNSEEEESTTPPQACSLTKQQAYSYPQTRAVYYITEDCTKRPFRSASIYFTYFTSWNDVRETTQQRLMSIADDELGFMPLGPLYAPASGTLVKTPSNPDVYLLLNSMLYLVDDEEAAEFQFGENWATWIEDVDVRLIENTPKASVVLDTETRPDGMILKYATGPETYLLENQTLRWIPNEATFTALGFRWDRIVVMPESENYPVGSNLTN